MTKTITKRTITIPELPTLTKVAAYARVSSGKDEMLHSLAAQVSYYSSYIQQHPGWFYAGVYADEAMTGTTDHALLQKRYVEDHLTKKLVQNNGKLQKYYARDTHPAIIDQETFAKAQEILSERRDASKNKNGSRNRYPFSGMIRCGICGSKYKRKDQKGKVAWYCTTYLEQGKSSCPSKQIPEPTLYSICNEVLGLLDFNPAVFKKNVIEIVVPEPGKVIFTLKDGHQISKEWKHASRRDSWSDNMRKAARGLANGGEPNGIC